MPRRTVIRVPSQSDVVSHSVPIAPAETEPVAVFQLPPFSDTQRRRCGCFFFGLFFLFFVSANARGATEALDVEQPVSGDSLNCAVGANPAFWVMVKGPENSCAVCCNPR